MKKWTAILTALVLVLSLTACGDNQAGNAGTGGNGNSNAQGSTQGSGDNASTEGDNETEYGVGVTLEEVHGAVVAALGDNYWPNAQIPADMLNDIYGVSEDLYEEFLGEMPMISGNVDTLIIIKAKTGQVEAVEEALNGYRDVLVNDTMQYPMNLGKIQASRIETFGQYVCFVQLGADTLEASDVSEEAVIEQCQQDNELALEVIENTLAKNQ